MSPFRTRQPKRGTIRRRFPGDVTVAALVVFKADKWRRERGEPETESVFCKPLNKPSFIAKCVPQAIHLSCTILHRVVGSGKYFQLLLREPWAGVSRDQSETTPSLRPLMFNKLESVRNRHAAVAKMFRYVWRGDDAGCFVSMMRFSSVTRAMVIFELFQIFLELGGVQIRSNSFICRKVDRRSKLFFLQHEWIVH